MFFDQVRYFNVMYEWFLRENELNSMSFEYEYYSTLILNRCMYRY